MYTFDMMYDWNAHGAAIRQLRRDPRLHEQGFLEAW